MSTVTQHGYFVLADISGYTSFVAKTELDHSHEIISELLELLVEKIKPLMTISKIEGDAVFAYVDEAKVTRGETLLEFMESVYVAFRDRLVAMRRKTTCTCRACANIPSLDLKFIAHHGDYVVQRVANVRELIGSDVNLIHRLSKNHVREATGWGAYMMITENCTDHLSLALDNAHMQVEAYEHLGEVKTYNINLHDRYREITDERRVFVSDKEADLTLTVNFPVPVHVAWEWLQDPAKRNLWSPGVTWSVGERPRGRTGAGASNHCAHGKGTSSEMVLDWRPFDYVTVDSLDGGGRNQFTDTAYFESLPDGTTRFKDNIRIKMFKVPRLLRKALGWFMFIYKFKYDQLLKKAADMAREEYERRKPVNEQAGSPLPA